MAFKMQNYMREVTLNIVVFIWLLFVLTNANTNLGNAYLWFLGIGTTLLFVNVLFFDKDVKVTFQKTPGGHAEAFFAGVAGWILLLICSFFILNFLEPIRSTFSSILSSLGSANPAFSNSRIINWITITFAIGYAETQLWARILEFLADRFKIQINRSNMSSFGFVIMVIFLSLLFVIFHLTSKGVNAVNSLVIVFTMMVISLFMIAYFNGETRQAVWLHIISNGVAGWLILQQGGII